MYRLDSHIHCQYSPDSSTKIDDIIKKSIEDKIDIVAISDHNTVEGSKGIIGVIGPKRMEYSKTVGLVNHVSAEVKKMMKKIE